MPANQSLIASDLIAAIEAGAWVVTASQRSAHRLRLLYANHCVAQGRFAWATPSILAFSTFAQTLWRSQGDGKLRVLTAQQSKLVWERVVAASEWASSLLSPQLAASGAYRSFERTLQWGIRREQLRVFASQSEEARALLEWSDRFDAICTDRDWLPEAMLAKRLLNITDCPGIEFLAITSSTWLPIQESVFQHLKTRGVRIERLGRESPAADAQEISCESADQELQSAALWARKQLSNGARSVAVAVPNLDEQAAAIRRVFAETFAQSTRIFTDRVSPGIDRQEQESSFSIAAVHRLLDFPLVRCALDLLQLVGGRATGSLIGAVLRNPFLVGAEIEAPSRALADQKLRESAREHYDLPALERLATSAGCSLFAASLREARVLRQSEPVRSLPSAVAEHVMSLWKIFGWPGDRTLDSDEQQILTRLQSCLGELGALDDMLGSLTFSAGIRELELLVRNTNFEPRSFPSPITVLDTLAVDDQQFESLWVAGMNEAEWPPPANPDPYIPMELQIKAGMTDATARSARTAARNRFERLQSAAASVVFSWARKQDDVELLPSPWLSELPQALPENADIAATMPLYANRVFAARPTLEVLAELRAPGVSGQRAAGGARIFELQSQCPFRAYAELRLAARPLDAMVPSIDARDRGTLVHATLETLWQQLGSSAQLAEHRIEQLLSMVRTTVARHAAPLLDGASPHRVRLLQIEQELAVERILALLELDRLRAPFRVAGRPETKEQVEVAGLGLEVRLDRVDEVVSGPHAGGRIIVDYKTGSKISPRSWFRDRPEQPQLPLYAVTHPDALVAVAFATVSAQSVAYQGVARDENILPDVKKLSAKDLPPPYAEWTGLLEYWRTIIERLAGEFLSGDARVDPLPNACRYCHLSTLCRVHERQGNSAEWDSMEEEE